MSDGHTARDTIAWLSASARELEDPRRRQQTDGPINWDGYDVARRRAKRRTGSRESVVCAVGDIAGVTSVIIAFEFGYFGGSLGECAGDRLEAAHEYAREHRLPVVSLLATGGSRMQEGTRALAQLPRMARQTAFTRAAGLPHIAVLRDPVTGGGWATLGSRADVILALPDGQVAFAGARVRPVDAEASAYTAQSQFDNGHIDQIVSVEALPAAVGGWLSLLTHVVARSPEVPRALGRTTSATSGWDSVARARDVGRPRARQYLESYFDSYRMISGDRCGGSDDGMLCGFGSRAGRTIAFAAQDGTATRPSGYRTAARLLRLADQLGIPVLTLVDTPGAANDAAAERAGIGGAIAEVFDAIATATVPISSLLIGEGGSGGAMALVAPRNLWVTADSYFSVIAPEAAAAILKRPPAAVPDTAEQLRLRPDDLVDLGIARGVVQR